MSLLRPSRVAASMLVLAFSAPLWPARAGDGGDSAADQAFSRGKALIDSGRIPEACRAFAESYGIEPALGTLLNLAWCHEKEGRRALAIAEYQRAESESGKAGQDKRARFARQRLDALKASVPFIQLELAEPSLRCEVSIDRSSVDPATLQQAIPLDPGEHVLAVRAAGRRPFLHRLVLPAQGGVVRVLIPRLEPLVQVKTPPGAEATRPAPARRSAYLIGGLGIAAIGTGTYFGLRTLSLQRDAEPHCTGRYCDDTGLELTASADRSATVSTVSFLLGGAALAAGAWLLLSSPGADPPRVRPGAAIAPGGGMLSAVAEF